MCVCIQWCISIHVYTYVMMGLLTSNSWETILHNLGHVCSMFKCWRVAWRWTSRHRFSTRGTAHGMVFKITTKTGHHCWSDTSYFHWSYFHVNGIAIPNKPNHPESTRKGIEVGLRHHCNLLRHPASWCGVKFPTLRTRPNIPWDVLCMCHRSTVLHHPWVVFVVRQDVLTIKDVVLENFKFDALPLDRGHGSEGLISMEFISGLWKHGVRRPEVMAILMGKCGFKKPLDFRMHPFLGYILFSILLDSALQFFDRQCVWFLVSSLHPILLSPWDIEIAEDVTGT